MDQPLSVAWFVPEHPFLAGDYYRGTRPAELCHQHFGWDTFVADQLGTVAETDRVVAAVTSDDEGEFSYAPDVLVIRNAGDLNTGPSVRLCDLVDQAHEAGQYVVCDLDDDVWAHEEWADLGLPRIDDGFEAWAWKADAWLVSTPYLAGRIPLQDGYQGQPVYVAPNCYDPSLFAHSQPVPGNRIGTRLWMWGRVTKDLSMYEKLYGPLLEDLDLTWVHIGYGGMEGKRFPTFPDDCGFPADRTLTLPSVYLTGLGSALGATLSIGCIALGDHPFNWAKTETHAWELAAAGLPTVAASNLSIYDQVPGRVDPTPDAVRQRVTALLDRDYWWMEQARGRMWAEHVAARHEHLHLSAVTAALAPVL